MEAVSFPSAEAALIAFLKSRLAARSDSAAVAASVPASRPSRMVKVTRVGGRRSGVAHDEALVTFECWETSPTRASSLALLVRALVASFDSPTAWYSGEVGGPASFPDPLSDSPRYQFTAIIRTRGEAIS